MRDLDPQRQGDPERPQISLVTYAFLSLLGVMTLYAIGTALFQWIGADYVPQSGPIEISSRNFMIALAAGQVFFLLIPTIRLAARHRLGLDRVLRFGRPPAHFMLYAVGLTLSALILTAAWGVLQELFLAPLVPESIRQFFSPLDGSATLYDKLLVGRDGPLLLLGLFTVALVPAVTEELFFRGLIQRSIEQERPPSSAIALVALIFGLIHLQPVSLIPMIALGWLLGYLAWSSGSILPAILLHFLFNATQFLGANLLDRSGEVTLDLEDPAIWGGVQALMVLAGLALVLLVWIVRRIGREAPPSTGE